MRIRLFVALSLLLCATVRCAIFGSSDAQTPAADAGQESSIEGDGSSAAEAGDGSSTVGDASPPCGHTMCDDFERADPAFDGRWSSELGSASHTISSALGAHSGSRALVITQSDGGTDSYLLVKNFQGPVSKLHCSLAYYIEQAPDAYAVSFRAMLNGGPDSGTYAIEPSMRPASDTRQDVIVRVPGPGVDYVTLGARVWHVIEFEVPRLRLWYNGIEQSVIPPDTVDGPFGGATFEVGLQTNSPNPGWRVAVDDVVCDVIPP